MINIVIFHCSFLFPNPNKPVLFSLVPPRGVGTFPYSVENRLQHKKKHNWKTLNVLLTLTSAPRDKDHILKNAQSNTDQNSQTTRQAPVTLFTSKMADCKARKEMQSRNARTASEIFAFLSDENRTDTAVSYRGATNMASQIIASQQRGEQFMLSSFDFWVCRSSEFMSVLGLLGVLRN